MLIVPAAFFLLIAYFAVSGRSSPPVRRAAVIALIILTLAVIVCLLLVISRPAQAPGIAPAVIIEEAPARPQPINWRTLIAVILFIMGIIIAAILRDRRKSLKKHSSGPFAEDEPEDPF
ncbi:MAG: hypothetical protein LBU28_10695 [Spirochaetaceae bacterium]|nr:hypothetical protein [Spirochaetaceae bacterium]